MVKRSPWTKWRYQTTEDYACLSIHYLLVTALGLAHKRSCRRILSTLKNDWYRFGCYDELLKVGILEHVQWNVVFSYMSKTIGKLLKSVSTQSPMRRLYCRGCNLYEETGIHSRKRYLRWDAWIICVTRYYLLRRARSCGIILIMLFVVICGRSFEPLA